MNELLRFFNLKVEQYMFPFMASIGYERFEHSWGEQSESFSKYEFRKSDERISIYLGLNRLDYNDGIRVTLNHLSGSLKILTDLNGSDLYLGYSEGEIDQSMVRIKDCLIKVLGLRPLHKGDQVT